MTIEIVDQEKGEVTSFIRTERGTWVVRVLATHGRPSTPSMVLGPAEVAWRLMKLVIQDKEET